MKSFVVILVQNLDDKQVCKKVRLFASDMLDAKLRAEKDNIGYSAFSVRSQQ